MVNCATRWIGLIMITTLLAGSAAAEDFLLSDSDGWELPYDSSMPAELDEVPLPMEEIPPPENFDGPGDAPSRLVAPSRTTVDAQSSGSPSGMPYLEGEYPVDSYGGDFGENGYVGDPENYPRDSQPAPISSSSTWLNRGIWYAEFDALILNRIWQRGDTFIGAEDQNVTIPNTFPSVGLGLNTNRSLHIPSSHPGGDAGVRTTLGRFLFRDDQNRDHTAEFTAWAAGDWVSDGVLASNNPNGLFVTFNLDGGNTLFDQSSFQRVIYNSRLNSFELNYRIKKRLGRDRMVMDPNGRWRRESASGFNRNFLAGFRYVEVNETLNWTAQDIVVNGANGQYLIDTSNDLFGFQLGQGIEYESGRWSMGLSGKMGLYWNNADSRQQMNLTASDTNDFDRRATEAEISWIGEAELLGRYHITPNSSLRVGLEFMVIDSLALAPRQINFINQSTWIETGGSPFYMGGLLGFEFYW